MTTLIRGIQSSDRVLKKVRGNFRHVDMVDSEVVALCIHPLWPFNMLRIRAAPKPDAEVIEIIPPSSFSDVTFTGVDAGNFWEIQRSQGRAYVIKTYEGYTTLVPMKKDLTLLNADSVNHTTIVQVQTITGEVAFGPAELTRSLTIAQLKDQLRLASPSLTSEACRLLLDDSILHDGDSLESLKVDESVTLTLAQIDAHLEIVDQWHTWAKSPALCHKAYGDGGMVQLRLVFSAPVLSEASEIEPAGGTPDNKSNVKVEGFKRIVSQWPFAERHRPRKVKSGPPSVESRLLEVANIAEKYEMTMYRRGEIVWGPQWDCWLRKADMKLAFTIQQNVVSCDLD